MIWTAEGDTLVANWIAPLRERRMDEKALQTRIYNEGYRGIKIHRVLPPIDSGQDVEVLFRGQFKGFDGIPTTKDPEAQCYTAYINGDGLSVGVGW